MNNVAFLGTGLLGGAMVERMLAQGDSVTVWNRTPSKLRMDELIAAGHGKDDLAAIAAPVVRSSS